MSKPATTPEASLTLVVPARNKSSSRPQSRDLTCKRLARPWVLFAARCEIPAQRIATVVQRLPLTPRHTGDFTFYRAYVGLDGRPAKHSEG